MLGSHAQEVTLFNYCKHHGLDFPLNLVEENKDLFTKDFIKWIPNNLHIFAEFCARSHALKKSGRKRYGAKSIMETIRFDTYLREKPDYEFKINNNYTAYLARLAIIAYNDLDGFFEFRETKAVNSGVFE